MFKLRVKDPVPHIWLLTNAMACKSLNITYLISRLTAKTVFGLKELNDFQFPVCWDYMSYMSVLSVFHRDGVVMPVEGAQSQNLSLPHT